MMKTIILSIMPEEEPLISEINGFSLDDVLSMRDDIYGFCEYLEIDYPKNALAAIVELRNIRFNEAQIGIYPPPNVEIPSHWSFAHKLIGFDVECDNEVVLIPTPSPRNGNDEVQ